MRLLDFIVNMNAQLKLYIVLLIFRLLDTIPTGISMTSLLWLTNIKFGCRPE